MCLPADGRVAIVCVASGRVCLKVIRLLRWADVPVILVELSCCSREGMMQEMFLLLEVLQRLMSGWRDVTQPS